MTQYTRTPPTETGWYWVKAERFLNLPDIVEVVIRPGHEYLSVINPERTDPLQKRDFLAVAKLGAMWCGPIERPSE